MTGCHVTLVNVGTVHLGHGKGHVLPSCGKPVVKYGLCEKHYGDRVRLGGAA